MSYIRHKAEESLEDYPETILILSRYLFLVCSIDMATELNYSKPGVSGAVINLKIQRAYEGNRDYVPGYERYEEILNQRKGTEYKDLFKRTY